MLLYAKNRGSDMRSKVCGGGKGYVNHMQGIGYVTNARE